MKNIIFAFLVLFTTEAFAVKLICTSIKHAASILTIKTTLIVEYDENSSVGNITSDNGILTSSDGPFKLHMLDSEIILNRDRYVERSKKNMHDQMKISRTSGYFIYTVQDIVPVRLYEGRCIKPEDRLF